MKKYHQLLEAATIPVENIRCPILIFLVKDKIWPSTFYGNFIEKRLKKKDPLLKQSICTFQMLAMHFLNILICQ